MDGIPLLLPSPYRFLTSPIAPITFSPLPRSFPFFPRALITPITFIPSTLIDLFLSKNREESEEGPIVANPGHPRPTPIIPLPKQSLRSLLFPHTPPDPDQIRFKRLGPFPRSLGPMRLRARTATAGVLALSLCSSSSSSSSIPIFPSQRLIDRCAHRAQHKQRRNHSAAAESPSVWDRLGNALAGQNMSAQQQGRAPFVSGLPVRQVRYDHVHRRGALFCRTGNWLELAGEPGQPVEVRGTRREESKFTVLEFLAVAFGLVSLRSVANQHYLCMDSTGQLYAAPARSYSAECVFMEEMLHNYYNLYSSCAHGTPRRPWFVALRRTGTQRRGRHSRRRQKSSHFVIVDKDAGGQTVPAEVDKGTVLDGFGHSRTRVDSLAWKYFYDLYSAQQKQSRKGSGKKLKWELPGEVVLLEGHKRRKRMRTSGD